MFIKDIEALTKLHICPKCHVYILTGHNNGNYRKDLFDKHVEKCDGTTKPKLCLRDVSIPYVPHIFKNPLYAFLLANGRENEYVPISNYITYDFETVNENVNEKYGENCNWDSKLHLVSGAWTRRLGDKIESDSLFRPSSMSIPKFVNNWLTRMFEVAVPIYEAEQKYYKSLNLPEDVKEKLSVDEEQEEEDDDINIHKKDKKKSRVKVIGYNSRKFDINLFITYLTAPFKIDFILGTRANYKSLCISSASFPFSLQFIDLQMFLGPGTLDKHAKAFSKEDVKGLFAYEKLTVNNYMEELMKTEPFKHEDFYSSLTNSNITEKEYQRYLEDQAKFNN
jgi:hypothetical protein